MVFMPKKPSLARKPKRFRCVECESLKPMAGVVMVPGALVGCPLGYCIPCALGVILRVLGRAKQSEARGSR